MVRVGNLNFLLWFETATACVPKGNLNIEKKAFDQKAHGTAPKRRGTFLVGSKSAGVVTTP